MSPKLSPPNIGEVLARQGEDIDTPVSPLGGRSQTAQQGLPDALVVPAR